MIKNTERSRKKTRKKLTVRDFFGVGKLFSVKDLFDARVHLGHTPRSVDPRMRTFLYGSRFDTAVFDLDQTALRYRIFGDLWAVRTLMIRPGATPPLNRSAYYGFTSGS